MTDVLLNDPSGNWALDFLTSGGFDNPVLSSRTDYRLVISGSDGAAMTLTGNFYGTNYNYWSFTSVAVSEYGTIKFSMSDFRLSFSQLDNLGTSSMYTGDDSFVSNLSIGDYFQAYGGNDTIDAGTGNDTISGGAGTDRVIISDTFSNAKISSDGYSLKVVSADGVDSISSVEILQFQDRTVAVNVGSSASNNIRGDSQSNIDADLIFAGSGNDTVTGLDGHDRLWGGSGADSLYGNAGNDQLRGGDGEDALQGGGGRDALFGNRHADVLTGGAANDRLDGGGGNDSLLGEQGGDRLYGRTGSDSLYGGTGNDSLNGGSGRDVLEGHLGNDLLTGGAGSDQFLFSRNHGNDTITDFELGLDQIAIGRGASRLNQLEFEQQGDDVLLSFSNVSILVEDSTVSQLQDADNFLF